MANIPNAAPRALFKSQLATRQTSHTINTCVRLVITRNPPALLAYPEKYDKMDATNMYNPQQASEVALTRPEYESPDGKVTYACYDCVSDVSLAARDAIRCQRCGCRLLYKKKTKRICQFWAV
ncbi:hypothetical protein B0T19DRAFT_18717 [Cercophora scortea]|uniref:Uncharacterized protein n=1 Tax=Cercophora scortea TaxID=314031 RepID=A0AAE0ML77_9PEZI|nr:hypothetical protein B0T19DRAFT_18717 [Cercophora scortea]